MKKSIIAIITLVFSLSNTIVLASNVAENNNATAASVHYINAPRFVRPLIEKWIEEYKKVAPQANFAIAKTAANKNSSALNVLLTDKVENETNADKDLKRKNVYFGSYAILPVTSKNSEADKQLNKQELNTKKIKNLYFENEDVEAEDKASKKNSNWVVYTGNSQQSVANSFAAHYGKDASSFKGKRIVGDDQFLNVAVEKDPLGITFNAISNIYDLKTRKLKDNLSLLSLDVNKSQRQAFDEGATIDELIQVLESNHNSEIPVEKVGFAYDNNDVVSAQFIAWVLSEGEQYNHQYGLLK